MEGPRGATEGGFWECSGNVPGSSRGGVTGGHLVLSKSRPGGPGVCTTPDERLSLASRSQLEGSDTNQSKQPRNQQILIKRSRLKRKGILGSRVEAGSR